MLHRKKLWRTTLKMTWGSWGCQPLYEYHTYIKNQMNTTLPKMIQINKYLSKKTECLCRSILDRSLQLKIFWTRNKFDRISSRAKKLVLMLMSWRCQRSFVKVVTISFAITKIWIGKRETFYCHDHLEPAEIKDLEGFRRSNYMAKLNIF
jgi:hypothetical protein